MLTNKNVAFLGAGSMAEAMISGIVQSKKVPAENIFATNRSNAKRLHELTKKYGIQAMSNEMIPFEDIDIFILAMKPKDAETSLMELKQKVKASQVIGSVLAGISLEFMEQHLHEGQPVFRIMPNTSSTIGESATAICSGTHVSQQNEADLKTLLECMGTVSKIKEQEMDVFTGIAGSGPAYIYYLIEHIEQSAVEQGMDRKKAREIATQTIFGASKMVSETKEDPSTLRKKVTSPNGTTAAGLEALDKNGGGKAIASAVRGAATRSKEISDSLKNKLLRTKSRYG